MFTFLPRASEQHISKFDRLSLTNAECAVARWSSRMNLLVGSTPVYGYCEHGGEADACTFAGPRQRSLSVGCIAVYGFRERGGTAEACTFAGPRQHSTGICDSMSIRCLAVYVWPGAAKWQMLVPSQGLASTAWSFATARQLDASLFVFGRVRPSSCGVACCCLRLWGALLSLPSPLASCGPRLL